VRRPFLLSGILGPRTEEDYLQQPQPQLQPSSQQEPALQQEQSSQEQALPEQQQHCVAQQAQEHEQAQQPPAFMDEEPAPENESMAAVMRAMSLMVNM
jgi:hypothetical protein